MSTLVGVAALLLMVTAFVGIASGSTSVGDEASHLLVVAGWVILRFLAYTAPPEAEKPLSEVERFAAWMRRRTFTPMEGSARTTVLRPGVGGPAVSENLAGAGVVRQRRGAL
ncbi:MAG: hypothetical protein ACRDYY_17210 [Acidimicrobiales bacterium]